MKHCGYWGKRVDKNLFGFGMLWTTFVHHEGPINVELLTRENMRNKLLLTTIFCILLVAFLKAQPAAFYPYGIGGGGSLFFPSFNPANDDEFYVSCDMSGLFHSTDLGHTYSLVDFRKLQVFGNSTYEFTGNPDIAYCNFNDGNDGYPVRTGDGGATWAKLPGYNPETYGRVYKMSASFGNPGRLLVGSYGDILFSNDGGDSFSLVKHAANMGAGLIMGGVFWDGEDIYIGTNEGIFYSLNGGASFTKMVTTGMAADQVIWSFAGAGSASGKRFVCIAANLSDTYNGINPWEYYGFAKAVYSMDNANGVWIDKSAGINFAADFIMYAAMAHSDIDHIFLGGHDEALSAPLVLKSPDGGASWAKKFRTTNNENIITGWEGDGGDKEWSWSETCFGISVAYSNPEKVLFGSYSNVETSEDGGESWRQAYVDPANQNPAGSSTPKNKAYRSVGLENTSCWQVHWSDTSTMMGCFSDIGGIRSTDGGRSWGYQYSGFSVNSLYRIEEGPNKVMYGACSGIHDMYQSTRLKDAILDLSDASGKIIFSSDKGATWSLLHQFGHPVYWLAIDPGNTQRMYASVIHFGGVQGSQAGGIYRTDNLGSLGSSSWVKLPNPSRTEGHPAAICVLNDGKVVCTFSGRINPSGAFTASSGVFIYDPVQNSWTDVSDPGMLYWTQDIVPDPGDPLQNTWYACVYSGWGGAPNGLGGLYKTINRGAAWTKLTGSMFDRVTSLTFDPHMADKAYLTTETQGLWLLDGMGTGNPSESLVDAYPFRQPQRVFFNPYDPDEVWVTSFGNGMKKGNYGTSGIPGGSETKKGNLVVYPDPVEENMTIRLIADCKSPALVRIFNGAGLMISSQEVRLEAGTNTIALCLPRVPAGIYGVEVKTGTGTLLFSKFLKQ
jgi:hypothetical protein